jgi:hypothetical protein
MLCPSITGYVLLALAAATGDAVAQKLAMAGVALAGAHAGGWVVHAATPISTCSASTMAMRCPTQRATLTAQLLPKAL